MLTLLMSINVYFVEGYFIETVRKDMVQMGVHQQPQINGKSQDKAGAMETESTRV